MDVIGLEHCEETRLVRDDEHGIASAAVRRDCFRDDAPRIEVEAAVCFIEHGEDGLQHEELKHFCLLLFSTGESNIQLSVEEPSIETQCLQVHVRLAPELRDGERELASRGTLRIHRRTERCGHRHARNANWVLEGEKEPSSCALGRGQREEVESTKRDLPTGDPNARVAEQRTRECRFPSAIRPHDGVHLALPNRERELLEDGRREVARGVANDFSRQIRDAEQERIRHEEIERDRDWSSLTLQEAASQGKTRVDTLGTRGMARYHWRVTHRVLLLPILVVLVLGIGVSFIPRPMPKLDLSRVGSVVLETVGSSVPPPYHREFRFSITPTQGRVVVRGYDEVRAEVEFSLTPDDFQSVINAIRDAKIAIGPNRESAGCTGGTSASLLLQTAEYEDLYEGDAYQCGGETYGTLRGDINAVEQTIIGLIPNYDQILEDTKDAGE